MPPVAALEDYLELVAAVEATAAALSTPVLLEGYPPPSDPRLAHFMITPDPGVIEVNVQPSESWDELVDLTTTVYEEASLSRLAAAIRSSPHHRCPRAADLRYRRHLDGPIARWVSLPRDAPGRT